jgi:hypothetical protein
MMFKLYHDGDYINRTSALGLDGIHQYYDDFEIWSDYPGEKRRKGGPELHIVDL